MAESQIEQKLIEIIPGNFVDSAVAAAKFSRHDRSTKEIHDEIVAAGGGRQFIKTNVQGYGHASVLDLVRDRPIVISGYSDKVLNRLATCHPLLRCQMTSSRYRNFHASRDYMKRSGIFTAEEKDYIDYLFDTYNIIVEKAGEWCSFLPNKSRRTTWTYDAARQVLPVGVAQRAAFDGSARTWNEVIQILEGSNDAEENSLAKHLREFFDTAEGGEFFTHYNNHVPNSGEWKFRGIDSMVVQPTEALYDELAAWAKSGYHRPLLLVPGANYVSATAKCDRGGRRDLDRHSPLARSCYPIPYTKLRPFWSEPVLEEVTGITEIQKPPTKNPLLAPMCEPVEVCYSGHIQHVLYMCELRTERKNSGMVDFATKTDGNFRLRHPSYSLAAQEILGKLVKSNPWLESPLKLTSNKQFPDR